MLLHYAKKGRERPSESSWLRWIDNETASLDDQDNLSDKRVTTLTHARTPCTLATL